MESPKCCQILWNQPNKNGSLSDFLPSPRALLKRLPACSDTGSASVVAPTAKAFPRRSPARSPPREATTFSWKTWEKWEDLFGVLDYNGSTMDRNCGKPNTIFFLDGNLDLTGSKMDVGNPMVIAPRCPKLWVPQSIVFHWSPILNHLGYPHRKPPCRVYST